MNFLPASYNPPVVLASLLMAGMASHVALDLSRRLHQASERAAWAWWLGGSVAMGTGIWCMHFLGMLAFTLPIALAYTPGLTAASWLAAVGASALALGVASRGAPGGRRLLTGSLAMAAGICTMHYTGMAALAMSPAVVWNPLLVAASALVALGASAAALLIFAWLPRLDPRVARRNQALAAALMAAAVAGMHYLGMAAAGFPVGTVCLSRDGLAGGALGGVVGAAVALASLLLLGMGWLAASLDARLQRRTASLSGSLAAAQQQLGQARAVLREQAFTDALTGLPNRLLFEARLEEALGQIDLPEDPQSQGGAAVPARPPVGKRVAVLWIDLDGFKPINDSLGHAAGDRLLQEAARRLRRAVRDSDTVARIGADEFLVLAEDLGQAADGLALARRLAVLLAQPFEVGAAHPVEISCSVGLVVHPDQGLRHKLIAQADLAMNAAKRAGGNTCAVFEPSMDADLHTQLSLQSDLRHAIERGELQLHYQPKIDARDGGLCGVEALLRWKHPQRGFVSPTEFIPIAERFGLIGGIGNWVIDEACGQIAAWAAAGLRMPVAINLSAHQLREAGLAERIALALARCGVEPACLLCELTESAAMDDVAGSLHVIDALARSGVFLSIDDFGTGYSSLAYLRRLPARQLKIDRSFVSDLETSGDACAIVTAVVQLAHALGLRVVAEGVETAGQREILVRLGCDELQGYHFARPMPALALAAWAAARHGRPVVAASDERRPELVLA